MTGVIVAFLQRAEVLNDRCASYTSLMTMRTQRKLLVLFIVLVAAFAAAFVTQCARGWGRTRLVEQFDNGPILPGPDGKPRMNTGPSEGYLRVAEDASPPPGKQWRTVNPNDLSPEQRKQIR